MGFPGGPVGRESEDGALSDEVRGGVVLVQICKNRRKRIARVQIHRRLWIFGVHEDNKVRFFRKERHLACCVSAIGAVRVSLDKLAYGQAVRGFGGRNAGLLTHKTDLLAKGASRSRQYRFLRW